MIKSIESKIQEYFSQKGLASDLGKIELSQKPDLGEFQCNGSFSAAKQLNLKPQDFAQELITYLQGTFPAESFSLAGAGFINIKLSNISLLNSLDNNLSVVQSKEKVIIDYGSPNVAKGMHVGHLRSSLIGASLIKIHKFSGKSVIGDNHLGDWGTPLGIVISKIKPLTNFTWTLENIEALYVEGSLEYKSNPTFAEEVRTTTKNLQNNSPAEKEIWQKLIDTTVASLKKDYQELGVHFDLWLGESHFEKQIPKMIEELKNQNLITTSDGAVVLPLENQPPLILEKSGGGYLYHTTDLACIKERAQTYDKILYVVDKRQSLHFSQVFNAALKVNYISSLSQTEHVAFGTINGSDGKPFKTRDGGVLKLKDLISLMKQAASQKLEELGVNYTLEEKEEIIPLVAIGALKFAELHHNRLSDYVFDLDKFVALEGYTGPYVMYAGVRAKSILAKTTITPKPFNHTFQDSERELMVTLTKFTHYYQKALSKNEPHHLCEFSFLVANAFNNFYHHTQILKEPNVDLKSHYLWLTLKTEQTLATALNLLGITLPNKM